MPNCTYRGVAVKNYDGTRMGWICFITSLVGLAGYIAALILDAATKKKEKQQQQQQAFASDCAEAKDDDDDDNATAHSVAVASTEGRVVVNSNDPPDLDES